MALRPKHKRKIFWGILGIFCLIIATLLTLPTFITLNSLRPRLETAIESQTGETVKINGDINFGILGRTTIIANNVVFKNGTAKKITITIPFSGLFDLEHTTLSGDISLYGAKINISSLVGNETNYNIIIKDSVIGFMGKDYNIINGVFTDGTFSGTIRTDQHKYDIKFRGREFLIRNQNVKLTINGELFENGGASGVLNIETDKINSWFEFKEPKITETVKLSTNFWWDGQYAFRFYDLTTNNIHGNIELSPDGTKIINLFAQDTSFDFSFLARPTNLIKNTKIDLDFSGNLIFENQEFNHVKIDATGGEKTILINEVIADNISFTGGSLDSNGAHNIMIRDKNRDLTCLFSGTPETWKCERFTFKNFIGTIKKTKKNGIYVEVTSDKEVDMDEIQEYIEKNNVKNATIRFKFPNIGGTYIITPKKTAAEYSYVYGKTLSWLNPNMKFLPEFMRNETGNMVWKKDTVTFIPKSKTWSLTIHDNFFFLTGDSIRKWFPKTDWRSMNDFDYTLSGYYNDRGDISNLTLKMADHVFTGSASINTMTLKTDNFILDKFLNQDYLDHQEEMEFLTNAPILSLFDLDMDIYLTADTLLVNGDIYKNFTYALKSAVQNFSITDNSRGNLLATIVKERGNYDIFIQLNRFVINGKLLQHDFPLNVMDTTITAEIDLQTNGHIAHDIWHNLSGDIDITFDGGYITGLGIDEFYATANDLTRLNAEDRLANALSDGITKIKTMRIIGKYQDGDFKTTKPLQLDVRHANIVGVTALENNTMTTKLEILLRGTSTDPSPITLTIAPNGRRNYSLSDILRYIDPAYMRGFIKTHNKF